MKKQIKKLTTVLLAATFAFGMIGCSSEPFDASACVKAELDLVTKHDTTQYMEVFDVDEAEAEADYAEVIGSLDISNALLGDAEVSDELAAGFEEWFLNVLSNTKYTVLEAQETEEGYVIEVEVEPLKAFEGLEDAVNTEAAAYMEEVYQDIENGGEMPSDAQINEAIYSMMLDILNGILENPTYAEKIVIETKVIKNSDGDYEVDEDSFSVLGENLLDASALQ